MAQLLPQRTNSWMNSSNLTFFTTRAEQPSTACTSFPTRDPLYLLLQMHKKARIQVNEVRSIGMNPIAKAVDVDFQRNSTYNQFCAAIKEKFPAFDHKTYIIYFDKMAGIMLERSNFKEFRERINLKGNIFGEAHIHKITVDTSVGVTNRPKSESQRSSSSEDEDEPKEGGDGIQLFAAMMVDGDKASKQRRQSFLHKAFQGDPTDTTLKLTKEDRRFLENTNVVHKSQRPMDSKQEMEEMLTAHIINNLQEI